MRVPVSVLAAVILVSGTSCGAVQPRDDAEAPPTATTPVPSYHSTSWGVAIAERKRAPGEPTLVEQLAVFDEKRTANDVFESLMPVDPAPDTAEGKELYERSRLLADPNVMLIGVPTANGWVCPHFVDQSGEEGDSGPCWSTLHKGVSFSLEGDRWFYRLYGVAANDVESVTVVAGEHSVPADMGRNSFLFGAKTTVICPTELDRLVIEHASGEKSVIQLAAVSPLRDTESSRSTLGCR